MTKKTVKDKTNQELLKIATKWFVAIQEETFSHEKKLDFQIWLNKDPAHKQAYQEVVNLWHTLDSLKQTAIPELKAARNARPEKRLNILSTTIAVLLAMISGLAWQDYMTPDQFFSTGLAEKKQLYLTDGSSITLNANTRISTHESWIRRQINLMEGEAQFTANHDWNLFIVSTENLTIRDIGTVFNVRNRPETRSVTVLKGEVDLHNHNNWLGKNLKAGYSRQFSPNGELLTLENDDEQRAIAWIQDRLVFNHTPLNQVTAELERYHPVKFLFKTPGLAKQTISGNFGTHDLNSFLQAIDQIYEVNIHRHQQIIEISSKS